MNRISNYIAFISLFFVIISCNSHLNGVSQGVNYALKNQETTVMSWKRYCYIIRMIH